MSFEFEDHFEAVEAASLAELGRRLNEVGDEMLDYLHEKLTGPRTGREYYVPELGRTYTASAPGEYPAEKLSFLRSSINAQYYETPSSMSVSVGSDGIEYARTLELDMGRPFISRSFFEKQDRIKQILQGG